MQRRGVLDLRYRSATQLSRTRRFVSSPKCTSELALTRTSGSYGRTHKEAQLQHKQSPRSQTRISYWTSEGGNDRKDNLSE